MQEKERRSEYSEEYFTQSRKGKPQRHKENLRNAAALCAFGFSFVALRETSRSHKTTMKTLIAVVFFIACCWTSASAHDNGLAKTPPMGWNSWNKFACNVSEKLIKDMADAMVTSGMRDAGYIYLVIDDCWQIDRAAQGNSHRDAQGNIQPDPKRFPSGMKALADYIHSKGLKFGLYSDAGTFTCQKRPGSRGYEFQDPRQNAAGDVDYLKHDWG